MPGPEHYMLKEIFEEPDVIKRTLADRAAIADVAKKVAEAGYTKIVLTGAGTSLHAGIAAAYALAGLAKTLAIPVHAVELRHTLTTALGKDTLVIGISQSGESTDTIKAIRRAKEAGADIMGVTNFPESTLAKESKYKLITQAGEEKAVVATKTYIAQLAILYAFAVEYAKAKGVIDAARAEELWKALTSSADLVKRAHALEDQVKRAAKVAKAFKDAFVFGSDVTYPAAVEMALKLKEACLIHSEAFPAPEFRHGPISLVEPSTLAVALYPPKGSEAHEAFHKVIKEVVGAGATLIAVAEEGDEAPKEVADFVFEVPKFEPLFASLLYIVPCQLLAYYIAIAKGLNPDQPRRLTKVVKVE